MMLKFERYCENIRKIGIPYKTHETTEERIFPFYKDKREILNWKCRRFSNLPSKVRKPCEIDLVGIVKEGEDL